MNGIHRAIKKFRELKEMKQPEMAEKLNISLKAYQNFENGITKLDLERLKEVANIFEIPIEDLINSEDGVYISEIKNNDVGFNNSEITINHTSTENERELYERIIKDKDLEIVFLKDLIMKLDIKQVLKKAK
ncbi:MAG: helix-turn-helix transcriptional regulator [Bacteroidetes bacterium]|nr:helix-turn-helix transcriptional regulator [Bacteroidota bacterium]